MEVTGNFSDFYGATMLPALSAIIDRSYKGRPRQFTQIFAIKQSNRSIEQFSGISGLGRFVAIDETKPISRDQRVQGYKTTLTHRRFGLAVATSVDEVEDDKWDLIGSLHRDLGWSCSETQEIDAASTFNNGFSASCVGPDGVALFSTAHPLYKAGGTQSNLMTAADLDMTSLQIMLTAWELQKRPSGELIHLPASRLWCHPSNRWIATALTQSSTDPSTANRSDNPLNGAEDGMPKPLVWRYLTNPNAWGIAAPPEYTGLVWFWRKEPYTKSWTDDDTEVGVIGMRYKKSHGWNNYLGVMGNQGQ